MRYKVSLNIAGRIHTTTVQAGSLEQAKRTALSRNPSGRVIKASWDYQRVKAAMENNFKLAGKVLLGLVVAFVAINNFGSTENGRMKRI